MNTQTLTFDLNSFGSIDFDPNKYYTLVEPHSQL